MKKMKNSRFKRTHHKNKKPMLLVMLWMVAISISGQFVTDDFQLSPNLDNIVIEGQIKNTGQVRNTDIAQYSYYLPAGTAASSLKDTRWLRFMVKNIGSTDPDMELLKITVSNNDVISLWYSSSTLIVRRCISDTSYVDYKLLDQLFDFSQKSAKPYYNISFCFSANFMWFDVGAVTQANASPSSLFHSVCFFGVNSGGTNYMESIINPPDGNTVKLTFTNGRAEDTSNAINAGLYAVNFSDLRNLLQSCYVNQNCYSNTCERPTNLAAAKTSKKANISWTAPSSVPSNGYEYYISTSSATPTGNTEPSGEVTSPNTTSATITGLAPSTTYYFWVRSACSTSSKGPWSTSGSFTTYERQLIPNGLYNIKCQYEGYYMIDASTGAIVPGLQGHSLPSGIWLLTHLGNNLYTFSPQSSNTKYMNYTTTAEVNLVEAETPNQTAIKWKIIPNHDSPGFYHIHPYNRPLLYLYLDQDPLGFAIRVGLLGAQTDFQFLEFAGSTRAGGLSVDNEEEIGENIIEEQAMAVYPNPSDGDVAVVMTAAQKEKIRFTLIGVTGHPVFAAERMVEAGDQTISLNMKPLVSGIYIRY
jgi:Fibronectin type III domain